MLLTPSFEGRIHDKQIIVGYTVPSGSDLYQDAGFQGSRPGVMSFNPKRMANLEEKEKNRKYGLNM